jgi:preprotein translocase subunit SecB
MSDVPSDSPPQAPQGDPTQPSPPPLRFLGQYIKDMSFETPLAPEIFNILRQQAPEMDVTIDAAVRQIEGPVFEVTVSTSLNARAGDKTAFIMELVYACVAEVNPQAVPQEYVHSLLLIEVPRYLFPFLRQIVAETTGNGGFPPLMLQVVDFAEMYRRKFVDKDGAPPAEITPQQVH